MDTIRRDKRANGMEENESSGDVVQSDPIGYPGVGPKYHGLSKVGIFFTFSMDRMYVVPSRVK